MIIKSLQINDIGVFSGLNHFDLSPGKRRRNTKRPLTLIVGKNGSGKTTFFLALSLALFGRRGLGSKLSNAHYLDTVRSLRRSVPTTPGAKTKTDEFSVSASLTYVSSDDKLDITVKRAWTCGNEGLSEHISVICDGSELEFSQNELEVWLANIFPPEYVEMCLFNAEQLSTFTQALTSGKILRAALHRAAGLHLAQTLERDLEKYLILSQEDTKDSASNIDFNEVYENIQKIDNDILRAGEEHSRVAIEIGEIEHKIQVAHTNREIRLARADEIEACNAQIITGEEERQEIIAEVESLASGLLPFAFAKKTRKRLAEQLNSQASGHTSALSSLGSDVFTKSILERLSKNAMLAAQLGAEHLEEIERIIYDELQASQNNDNPEDVNMLHDLSRGDLEKIETWLAKSTDIPSQNISPLLTQLSQSEMKLQGLADRVERLVEGIAKDPKRRKAKGSLQMKWARANEIAEKIGALKHQKDELESKRQVRIDSITSSRTQSTRLEFANKARLASKAYVDAVSLDYADRLAQEIYSLFSRIAHKNELIKRIEIDSDSFLLKLHGTSGKTFNVSDLSSGEKQLLALCLLGALRNLTKVSLPLVIDMPLGRLDHKHRRSLAENFFPDAADQVILTVMDSELSGDIERTFQKSTAQAYYLEFDERGHKTLILPSSLSNKRKDPEQIEVNI